MINPNNLCPGCMNEKVTEGKCPICGYNPEDAVNTSYLAPNSLLDSRYVIGKVLDVNGEGVTYLGYDTVTATTVNIREYFPQGLCERDTDGVNVLMLSGCEYSYNDALTKFIELSRELFKLNELPALFDVLDVRESNNTSYRITRSVPGITLREFLMRNGGVLNWDQTRSLFAPLVASISALHSAGIIHRGISPDTLIVGKDGKLRLQGFCISDTRTANSALTSQLFPGFAAVEQYGEAGVVGPWTDIYAFSATIYRTLVGNPPPEATTRLENDNMTIPAKVAKETPKAVLETLASALQVLPDDRTQNIDSMRRGLSISSAQMTTNKPKTAVSDNKPASNVEEKATNTNKKPKKNNNSGKMYGLVAGIVTAFALGIIVFLVFSMLGIFGGDKDVSSNSSGNGLSGVYENINTTSESSKDPIVETNKLELVSFVSQMYSAVSVSPDYKDNLKFKIVSKVYNEEYIEGQIISQNPQPGEVVPIGTTVEVVVSLGPSSTNMPDVIYDDEDHAILELLKTGFNFNDIIVKKKYVEGEAPGCVIQTDPAPGTRVSLDSMVTIIINDYTGVPTTPPSGSNSSETE